ncbi:DUF6470 family protein [Oscillospiraceae bacterium PP1C4]
MMQLLKITSVPIEYKIQIERPRLELNNAQSPSAKISQTPSKIMMRTQNVKVRLDTSDMRSSIGLKSAPTLISEAAQRGLQAAQRATAEYAQFGNQMSQIQDGATIANITAQKLLRQPDTQLVFLPSTGPEITWQPNSIEKKYQPGHLGIDWKIERNVMDYVPGKFQMSIMQYPKVQIEYLGEPNYVPPSASPNYEEESA